ncbi:MAG: hypothetical protein EBR81_01230 [Proteobacteria bacterium]|nr:hypothetical protein [Pseudomonadota bacterium]
MNSGSKSVSCFRDFSTLSSQVTQARPQVWFGAQIGYVQQLLGHEKLETTAIYAEVNIRQLHEF